MFSGATTMMQCGIAALAVFLLAACGGTSDSPGSTGAPVTASPSAETGEGPGEIAFEKASARSYLWLGEDGGETLLSRIQPPKGFGRVPAEAGSFGAWLRGLPLKPGRPPVYLYDGLLKLNQKAR